MCRTMNQAASVTDFRYHQTMTIGITGPGRRAPGRSAVVGLIIAAIFAAICLIVLGLASDLLVDWLWFSSIGYLQVFLTSIGAKAAVFFAVFVATAIILWLNGLLAARFAQRPPLLAVAASAWKPAGITPPPDPFAVMRDRLPWPRFIAWAAQACSLCLSPREKLATGVSSCSFSITCHMAQTTRSTRRTSVSICLSLPAYIAHQELDAAHACSERRFSQQRSTGCTATSNTTLTTDRCRRR